MPSEKFYILYITFVNLLLHRIKFDELCVIKIQNIKNLLLVPVYTIECKISLMLILCLFILEPNILFIAKYGEESKSHKCMLFLYIFIRITFLIYVFIKKCMDVIEIFFHNKKMLQLNNFDHIFQYDCKSNVLVVLSLRIIILELACILKFTYYRLIKHSTYILSNCL